MTVLCFYINTSDDEGPYFNYFITDLEPPHSRIKVVSMYKDDVIDYVGFDRKWVSPKLSIKYIIENYDVKDFFEVHDWYDMVREDEIEFIEKEAKKDKVLPEIIGPVVMVTLIKFASFPVKYLIPYDVYISLDDILLVEPLQLEIYKIKGTYDIIMVKYDIVEHKIIISDE